MPIANFNDAPPFNEKPRPTETVTKPSVLEQRKRVNREATPQLAANYPNIIRTTGTKSLQALSEYLDGIEKENSSNKKTQPKTTNHKKRAASLASNSPLAKRRSQGPGLPVREPKHGLSALISQVNPLEEDTTSAPITHTHLALLAKDTQENPVPKPKRPERRFIDPGLFTSPKRGISRRHSLTKVDWHGSPIQTGPQAPQESQILQRYEEQAAADNGQFGDRIETGDDASDSSPPPFQHLKYAGSGTLITPKIMSSNRKRLPGSPLAESTAISGHMPQQLLNKASMLAPTDESSNPFTQQAHKAGEITPDTDFMKSICRPAGVRRVKFVEPIPKEDRISPPVRGILWPKTLKALPAEPDEGPDKTLVGEEDEDLEKTLVDEENEASPCTLMISDDSSPELTSDPTTASSEQEDDPLAAEMEWEASLPPHQQDMVTILTRLSRHLVRNLIDKETAIHDIVAEYERVATAIVDNMEQKHKREYTEKRALVHEASAKVGRRFGEIEQRMGRELKEAERACRGVERGWEERLKEGEELVKGLRGMWERFEE
ncbi:uncharacterized protein K452DRAFT_287715 [Aplosporella prunicola CBS 121167]|uniref:Uncharacterized protein n=1 Tax=Aplosporella prunicola CBS 121167 TaxID=1176127 RepID=A0A6A6BCH0_9PEZI|nr:uncharacterized protein K452DRAFT_287715 [Aplosporella prunicola CBS 121167]KAF2141756.1 hypothetical protein K452DRAFT_287715 [Aplosporella prunicola CBS 121167]